jgi:BASS family bile acid:Na+ symporter
MIAIALSLSLAFIMFSLGITLLPRDFRLAALQPRALLAGAIAQVLLLPLVAFALVMLFGMRGELALGVMILSGCPGGVTSNLFTKFAKGDVALSISYTALASVISALSLPLLLILSSGVLMPGLNTSVSTAGLSLNMFTISTLPVLLGVVVHQHRPEWCRRIHSWCERASSILMAVVVIATVINQWSLFTTNLTVLGPVLLSLNLLMLAIGLGVGHILRLPQTQVTTLSIESGFQNGSVGIVVGTLLTSGATASDLPAYSLPSAIYGVIMLFTIIPMVVWRRLQARSAAPAAELPGF